jgi:putative membrane protein
MIYVGLVIVGAAALIHGYIFFLESIAWTSPRARAVFGVTAEQAVATQALAFNQGFYNLFLAVQVVAGIIAFLAGAVPVGVALILAGAGSMVLAGVVLASFTPAKAGAALKQLLPPLIGLIFVGLGLL